MSYIRTFYKQTKDFEANFNFVSSDSYPSAKFGLSGQSGNPIIFDVSGEFIKINNIFYSSLNKNRECSFSVCGNESGEITVWAGSKPMAHFYQPGFSFDEIFCDTPSGTTFSESLNGRNPELGHAFSGWNNSLKSGNIFIGNSGNFPLSVQSIEMYGSPINFTFSPFSIPPNSSGFFPVFYNSNSPFQSTGTFNVKTNAGDYEFSEYFNCEPIVNYSSYSSYLKGSISYPSGYSDFTISNDGNNDDTMSLFLNYIGGDSGITNSGSAVFPLASGTGTFNYSSGLGFYKKVLGSGLFSYYSSSTPSGATVSVPYSGNITGVGGRLGATGVQFKSGVAVLSGIVSGVNSFQIEREVDVYEGAGNINDFWNIIYNDIDRGSENFQSLGRTSQSGLGLTGVSYRVPAKSKVSGRITYSNNYSEEIFQRFVLISSGPSSINSTLYINS